MVINKNQKPITVNALNQTNSGIKCTTFIHSFEALFPHQLFMALSGKYIRHKLRGTLHNLKVDKIRVER